MIEESIILTLKISGILFLISLAMVPFLFRRELRDYYESLIKAEKERDER